MEKITQVHGITREDLFNAFQRLEDKINNLQAANRKPKKHSIKELAQNCGVAELTVRNWIADGKVKAERIGRRIFISEEEFQKALSEVKSIKYKR
ncbi:DNA binding domain-containing protein, excisionase family [Gillisia sp. Hel1_33_143]|uniref:excisionase family DNA-binding protein n=1 Tax=unclassified Gillisia TaxID=2615025 RepID=UPI00054FC8AC|nr:MULTISPECIES: helix-turn-helix domain-containing protein [unclassified Gillisia]SDS26257.1 DNA binding domain-containing protein, excisionase family [Gillisia sp. Hel1_33_143]